MLIVDASNHAVGCGQTSAKVLQAAHKRGARVFNCEGLHAKIIFLDDLAVIGSANLSQSSDKCLIEVAMFSNQPTVRAGVESLISQLMQPSYSLKLSKKDIQRLCQIEVRPPSFTKVPPTPPLENPANQTWLVGVHELDENAFPKEKAAIERGEKNAAGLKESLNSGVDWIRWSSASQLPKQAKKGDIIIEMWRKKSQKNPSSVYRHKTVLFLQNEGKRTRVFLEEGRNSEKDQLTYKEFLTLAKRVGIPGRIGPNSERILNPEHAEALHALWNGSHGKQ